ncbi:MAG: hypothetical protein Kow00127_10280 [Bacteroidales bacterium]
MRKSIFLTLLLLAAAHTVSVAQCCSAGNPYFYSDQSAPAGKQLLLFAGYKYSTSDDYYRNSEKYPIEFIDKAFYNYLNLQIGYGLSDKVGLEADLGYFLNKTETYLLPDWDDNRGYGVGDMRLVVKWLAYKNFVKRYSVIPSFGVKLPVGVFDQEVNNVKLPITVQPSSGSFRYQANLFVTKGFRNPAWQLDFYGSFEYAQRIRSKNFDYKYGNQFLFSVIGSRKIGKKLNTGIELRSENRGRALRENEQVVESSGHHIVYVIPHISFRIAGEWAVMTNFELPVYRYYNGVQLANSFALSITLSNKINLSERVKVDRIELNH